MHALLLLLGLIQAPAANEGALLREDLVLELLDRARWPLPTRSEIVAFAGPDDIELGPVRLRLGGRLYHVGADCVILSEAGTPVRLPFEGMSPVAGEPDTYRLALRGTKNGVELKVRLAGMERDARGRLRLRPTGTDGVGRGRQADADAGRSSPRQGGARHGAPKLRELDPGLPPWLAELGRELRTLGYEHGPHLALEIEGLERLFLRPPSREELFHLVWDLLLARFREGSARNIVDPGPGLRGREAFVRRLRAKGGSSPRRSFHSEDLEGLPALGLLLRKNEALEPSNLQQSAFDNGRFPEEAAIHGSLLRELLQGVRWPLPPLPERARRVHRPDDAWQRHGLASHRALDLGSSVWLEGAGMAGWPRGTQVSPPHRAGAPLPISRKDGRAWLVELRRGDYLLRVLFALYHLAEEGPPRLAGGVAGSGNSGWRSSEPLFRCLGLPKGNHVHLELLGVFPGAPERQALFLASDLPRAFARVSGREAISTKLAVRPAPFFASGMLARPGVRLGWLLHRASVRLPKIPGLVIGPQGWELRRGGVLRPEDGWQPGSGSLRLAVPLEPGGAALLVSVAGAGRGEPMPGQIDLTVRAVRSALWAASPELLEALCSAFLPSLLVSHGDAERQH